MRTDGIWFKDVTGEGYRQHVHLQVRGEVIDHVAKGSSEVVGLILSFGS